MDTKTQQTVDRVYEDYEPYYEWAKDEGRFTFMIPGYRRDQLRVQVTSKPALKLKGERPIIENRWRRFDVEFPIPPDYDLESVSARFEGGRLHIKFAKLVKPKETTKPPKEETSRPKETTKPPEEETSRPKQTTKPPEEETSKPKETTKPPEEETSRPKEEASQKVDQQNAAQEGTPKAKEDKAEAKTNNTEVSDQKTPQKENEPGDEKEKNKTEAVDTIEKVAKKEDKSSNGMTETKQAAPTKAPETKDAKPIARFKTRLLDFGPSFGPSNQVYNEELEDGDAGPTKRKRLVSCGLLTLLAVGLGLYAKNIFIPSHGGSKFEEL